MLLHRPTRPTSHTVTWTSGACCTSAPIRPAPPPAQRLCHSPAAPMAPLYTSAPPPAWGSASASWPHLKGPKGETWGGQLGGWALTPAVRCEVAPGRGCNVLDGQRLGHGRAWQPGEPGSRHAWACCTLAARGSFRMSGMSRTWPCLQVCELRMQKCWLHLCLAAVMQPLRVHMG